MGTVRGIIIGMTAVLAVGYCASRPEPTPQEPTQVAATAQVTVPTYRTWIYNSGIDDVSGKTWREASLVSANANQFDFPYRGDTYLRIIVREHPRFGRDVIFAMDQGQILCRSWETCAGAIRIDGKAERLTMVGPDDSSSEITFAVYDEAIRRKLTGAKKIVVELPVFQEGNRSWTFEPGNPLRRNIDPAA